jgi:hypothetical protein
MTFKAARWADLSQLAKRKLTCALEILLQWPSVLAASLGQIF